MKVITFGEIMLRLAPHGYYRFTQANDFEATFGGGEANVAVSLANYGQDVAFVTKLPSHDIGPVSYTHLSFTSSTIIHMDGSTMTTFLVHICKGS